MKIVKVAFISKRGTIVVIPEPFQHQLPEPGEVVEMTNPDGEKISGTVDRVIPNSDRVGFCGIQFADLPKDSVKKGGDMALRKRTTGENTPS